ncbi:hypothetical protein [Sneathiella aquimaris]|uniref:hypothetical protein n=1 Tax=Sneathiella aquimaris TaxID=2599305 RepID=UPI0015E1AE0C|nr:hypothetical protein [Sneathiella aquimaris]
MIKDIVYSLRLLLPAVIPSWRFFDIIAPSPRIEYRLLADAKLQEAAQAENDPDWREFRPRPDNVSVGRMMRRMVWNPSWNQSLFLVSCAERLAAYGSSHAETEIQTNIGVALKEEGANPEGYPFFQFRLIFISRAEERITKEVEFLSPVYSCFKAYSV